MKASPAGLRGLAWNHPRSWKPLQATSRAGLPVTWDVRSLDSFNEAPLDDLLRRYDMVVLDHPLIAHAYDRCLLRPIDDLVDTVDIRAAVATSVGPSHDTYRYQGNYLAIDVDSACQVAAHREDLLPTSQLPRSWADVIRLARARPGQVLIALDPANAWCCLLTLIADATEPFGPGSTEGIGPAYELLASLARIVPERCLGMDPPALLHEMATTDVTYTPLVFGYAIVSSRDRRIAFREPPLTGGRGPLLGGSGIAVSGSTRAVDDIARYLRWLLRPEVHRDVLARHGGQPPAALVWDDEEANVRTNQFFRGTRTSLANATIRPRAAWWPALQSAGMRILHEALVDGAPVRAVQRDLSDELDKALSHV